MTYTDKDKIRMANSKMLAPVIFNLWSSLLLVSSSPLSLALLTVRATRNYSSVKCSGKAPEIHRQSQ